MYMIDSFTAEELIELSGLMSIPNPFRTSSGHVFAPVEALSLLCARFRTAGDIYELTQKYARSQSAISECINELAIYLDNKYVQCTYTIAIALCSVQNT